jgi:hypothetical protein
MSVNISFYWNDAYGNNMRRCNLGRYVKSFIVITNCRTKLFYVISSGLYARKVTTLQSSSLTSQEESLSINLVIRKVLQTLSSWLAELELNVI